MVQTNGDNDMLIRSPSHVIGGLFAMFAYSATAFSQPLSETFPADQSLAPTGQFSVYSGRAAQKPPMGWNPWNTFHTDVDEAKIRAVARAIVTTGLAGKGYRYVNIDDGWALQRLSDRRLRIRSSMFPSAAADGSRAGSFAPLTAFLHGLGLKAGLYTDIGRNTCAQRWDAGSPNLPIGSVADRQVGSLGHSDQDMRTMFGTWRFDYVKIDACGVADYAADSPAVRSGGYSVFAPLIVRNDVASSDPHAIETLYSSLGNAVHRWGGGDAVLSICAWGEALSPLWGHANGNLYRTSPDIEFTWKSMLENLDSTVDGALYAGPGHWNDPDMLAIGHGDFDEHHLVEARAHFAMWAIMASPLLLGYDLRSSSKQLTDLVGNAEIIAVDQDAAGNQGIPYRSGDAMVVVRVLSTRGARAVAFFNRGERPIEASVSWRQLGFAAGSRAHVRDLWAHRDAADSAARIGVRLPPHGSALLRVQGTLADPTTVHLDDMPARVNVAVDGLSPQTSLPRGRYPARVGASPDGATLRAASGDAARGIGLFANSRLEIREDGEFRRFAVTPTVLNGNLPVRFRIYADRVLKAEGIASASLRGSPMDIDVAGARIVELVATTSATAGDRPPMIAWQEARFTR